MCPSLQPPYEDDGEDDRESLSPRGVNLEQHHQQGVLEDGRGEGGGGATPSHSKQPVFSDINDDDMSAWSAPEFCSSGGGVSSPARQPRGRNYGSLRKHRFGKAIGRKKVFEGGIGLGGGGGGDGGGETAGFVANGGGGGVGGAASEEEEEKDDAGGAGEERGRKDRDPLSGCTRR